MNSIVEHLELYFAYTLIAGTMIGFAIKIKNRLLMALIYISAIFMVLGALHENTAIKNMHMQALQNLEEKNLRLLEEVRKLSHE